MLKQLIRSVSQENNSVIEEVEERVYENIDLSVDKEIESDMKDIEEAMTVVSKLDNITDQQGIDIEVIEENQENPNSRITPDPRVQDVDIILQTDNLSMESIAGKFKFPNRESFYKFISSNRALESLNVKGMKSLDKLKITREGFLDVSKSLLASAGKTLADIWKKIWEFIKDFFRNRDTEKMLKNLDMLTKGFISLRRKTLDDSKVALMFPDEGLQSSFVERIAISNRFEDFLMNWDDTNSSVIEVMEKFCQDYLDTTNKTECIIKDSTFNNGLKVFHDPATNRVCDGFDCVISYLYRFFNNHTGKKFTIKDKREKKDIEFYFLGLTSDGIVGFNGDKMYGNTNSFINLSTQLGVVERISNHDIEIKESIPLPRAADLLNNIISNIDELKRSIKNYDGLKKRVDELEKIVKARFDSLAKEPFIKQDNMQKFIMLMKQTIIMNMSCIIRTPKTLVETFLFIGKKINNVYKD